MHEEHGYSHHGHAHEVHVNLNVHLRVHVHPVEDHGAGDLETAREIHAKAESIREVSSQIREIGQMPAEPNPADPVIPT